MKSAVKAEVLITPGFYIICSELSAFTYLLVNYILFFIAAPFFFIKFASWKN